MAAPWTALAVITGLLAPADALAYCRTKTCELNMVSDGRACPASTPSCERDEHCCAVQGANLQWESGCIEFAVQQDGSPRHGIDGEELASAALEAFARWQGVECPGGGKPGFEVQLSGLVPCDQHQTACRFAEGNVSTLIAYDEVWPLDARQLGVTTPAAVTDTGEIVDADVQLNLTQGEYSTEAGSSGYEALAYVLAHELGHFLGLGHSDQSDALMYYAYQSTRPLDELLSPDDVAAICEVFPPVAQALDCEPSAGPAYDECLVAAGDGGGAAAMGMDEAACIDVAAPPHEARQAAKGCSVAREPQPGVSAWMVAWAAALAVARARRARRR